MQGPTISPVYSWNPSTSSSNGAGGAAAERGFYAATICVPKARLYTSVKDLREVESALPFSNATHYSCRVSSQPRRSTQLHLQA